MIAQHNLRSLSHARHRRQLQLSSFISFLASYRSRDLSYQISFERNKFEREREKMKE